MKMYNYNGKHNAWPFLPSWPVTLRSRWNGKYVGVDCLPEVYDLFGQIIYLSNGNRKKCNFLNQVSYFPLPAVPFAKLMYLSPGSILKVVTWDRSSKVLFLFQTCVTFMLMCFTWTWQHIYAKTSPGGSIQKERANFPSLWSDTTLDFKPCLSVVALMNHEGCLQPLQHRNTCCICMCFIILC